LKKITHTENNIERKKSFFLSGGLCDTKSIILVNELHILHFSAQAVPKKYKFYIKKSDLAAMKMFFARHTYFPTSSV
jgi:hypothetical protein